MANTANKAQKFLLDNNCGDLILNDHRTTNPEDRIYASDIMMMFLKSERGQDADTSDGQLTIPDVSKSVCKHIYHHFENAGLKYIECIKCGEIK